MHDRCGGGDPVTVGHDHLIARPDTQCMHAHVQRTGAAAGRDGVLYLQFGNRGFGERDNTHLDANPLNTILNKTY